MFLTYYVLNYGICMIKKLIERNNKLINKTTQVDENKSFDVANEILKEIDKKINKKNDEFEKLVKKQKKFIVLSLACYAVGATIVILLNSFFKLSSIVTASTSLGYIFLGNIMINLMAKLFSSSITNKVNEIEKLKQEKEDLKENLTNYQIKNKTKETSFQLCVKEDKSKDYFEYKSTQSIDLF